MTWIDGLSKKKDGYRAAARTQVSGNEIDTEFYFEASDIGLLKDAAKYAQILAAQQIARLSKGEEIIKKIKVYR